MKKVMYVAGQMLASTLAIMARSVVRFVKGLIILLLMPIWLAAMAVMCLTDIERVEVIVGDLERITDEGDEDNE